MKCPTYQKSFPVEQSWLISILVSMQHMSAGLLEQGEHSLLEVLKGSDFSVKIDHGDAFSLTNVKLC